MKKLTTPLFIALAAVLCTFALRSPLASIEENVTALKYVVRGEQKADTNIVIVYVDGDAIRELGFPLRRNFYALMINALATLKAKVIGLDIVFDDPNLEYPEYDRLLQHEIRSAKNVVLASYFRSVERNAGTTDSASDRLTAFRFPQVANVILYGNEFRAPHDEFLFASAGVGHVNVVEDARLPFFISHGKAIVPAFAVETLRRFCDVEREGISFDGEIMRLKRDGKLMQIPAQHGSVNLNHVGRVASFTAYPFLEVLKSYDPAAREGSEAPTVPVHNLKDKIILIGVIGEGRTQTFATPFDQHFPPIGFHATFLDNALRSGFLSTVPSWSVYGLSVLVAFVCGWSVLMMRSRSRHIVPPGIILVAIVVSFALFVYSANLLPTLPFVVAGMTATATSLYLRHHSVKKQLVTVQSEKERIDAELRDKEAKVAMLERELVEAQSRQVTAERSSELLEEIRRYKAEIHALTTKADDLEEVVLADPSVQEPAIEFEGIVYRAGGTMQPVVDFIAKIAKSDAAVLVLGESGTGKEMVARAIHKRSNRAGNSFVAVNCGALSENLLESELFGHEKGAFTGAVKDRLGRFELADGGTMFLDEIGEVNEVFQLKLLRVLQEGEFERVGGTKTLKVNIRVVAATNQDLKQLVKERRFREDLFYRLNVLSVQLPPLRDRRDDIPLLLDHFLKKQGGGMRVSKNVLDSLQNFAWRGNIRELESAVTRAMLLARAEQRDMIVIKDLSDELALASKAAVAFEDQILESLREKGFSRSAISETADELGGLNRGTVAEHFRGICLKAFVERAYNIDEATRYLSLSSESGVNDRVRRKLQEYLANIADAVDTSKPWDTIAPALKPKTKNLPLKYHPFLEHAAEAFYRKVWKL